MCVCVCVCVCVKCLFIRKCGKVVGKIILLPNYDQEIESIVLLKGAL